MVGLDDLSSLFQPELLYGTQTPQIESGAGNSTIAACHAPIGVCSRQCWGGGGKGGMIIKYPGLPPVYAQLQDNLVSLSQN